MLRGGVVIGFMVECFIGFTSPACFLRDGLGVRFFLSSCVTTRTGVLGLAASKNVVKRSGDPSTLDLSPRAILCSTLAYQ